MFNYEKKPDWWAFCPKSECKMAETCLRHQVCMHTPEKFLQWLCVLPHATKQEPCEFYQKLEKVTMAKGITSIYKNVESRESPFGVGGYRPFFAFWE